MPYRIAYTPTVRQQIASLPGHVKAITRQRIAALSDNPRPPRSKELAGHPTYYRLWLDADHRLVWHVTDDEQTVEIEYVLGNHDHWTDARVVTRALLDAGLPVLRNERRLIERGNGAFWLAGVDDVWERHDVIKAANNL